MHGEMEWLADNRDVRARLDGNGILEGAKSVVCLAKRYDRPKEDEAKDPALARAIARYARGRDYHNVVRKKLRQLAAFVRTLGSKDAPVHARPLCDDAPVLERAWASRAGLGFVGKNGLLIVPGQGSFVLLGEVVTTLALAPDTPMGEKCGACTRCLDACPTRAFEAPFVLDARKCISYLTIERRTAIPVELRDGIGEHVFGCDECQTVCPFNAAGRREPSVTRAFDPHPRWESRSLESLVTMDDATWEETRAGSPVARATREGLSRNAAIALGNRGDEASRASLEAAKDAHPSLMVRDAAAWALAKIDEKSRKKGQNSQKRLRSGSSTD
jgi:epoxyqueuosine reductase